MITVSDFIENMVPLPLSELKILEKKYYEPGAVKAGEYLVRQGEVAKYVYFMQEGAMIMAYERGERVFIKDFLFGPDFAGVHPSLITGQPARYSLKAIRDCTFQRAVYSDLEELYQQIPALNHLSKKFTELIYLNMSQRFESLITLSAEERYLELLDRRPTLLSEVPLYLIASYLGITDVALSRIRNRIVKPS